MYSPAYVRTAKRFHKALYMVASIAKANDVNCNVTPALSIAGTFDYNASHVLEPKWMIQVFSWQLCTKRLKNQHTCVIQSTRYSCLDIIFLRNGFMAVTSREKGVE